MKSDLVRSIEKLDLHDHLCLIYETRDEQFEAIVPYFRAGLARGQKCVYIADDNTCEAVVAALRSSGLDTERHLASGALVVLTKQDAYLKQGFFDPDWMIDFLKAATTAALSEGFSGLRATGEMTWVLGPEPGVDRLLEYESKLNYFFPAYKCLAICQYNRRRFDYKILREVILTHPIVISGSTVARNFFYIPPDEYLNPSQSQAEVERLLNTIVARERSEAALVAQRDTLSDLNARLEQEIDARLRTEARLNHLNRLYSVITDANQLIVRCSDANELFEKVCALAVSKGSFQAAWIGLRDPGSERLFIRARAGAGEGGRQRWASDPAAEEGGLAWRALEQGRPQVCDDIASSPEAETWKLMARERGCASCAALPLLAGSVSSGILTLYASEPNFFTDRDMSMLQELRDDLCFALEKMSIEKARLNAEELIRKHEMRLDLVLKALPVGVWFADENGVIVSGNPAGQKIWEGARLVGPERYGEYMGWWAKSGQRIKAQDWALARAIDKKEISINEEIIIECFDRQKKYILNSAMPIIDPSGVVLGAIAVNQEITELKKAEEALKESERTYKFLFNHHPEAMTIIDLETLRILAVNDAAVKTYGYAREEFLQMTLRELRAPDAQPTADQLDLSSPLKSYTTRVVKKDLSIADVEIVSLELSYNGRPARMNIGTDVTEKRRQEALRLQSQKLEAVGQLAGGVAHDFNNLLTVILGYSSIALKKIAPDDPMRSDIEEINKAAFSASLLTRQLLTFSRKHVITPTLVSLNEVITNINRMLRRLIGEDITLETRLDPLLWPVFIDPIQLEQVIVNLAVNSRDAMPRGGTITVMTENASLDEAWVRHHPEARRGPYVRLAVKDNGQGMTEEIRQRIFEPFFTTKEPGKGTGLGLATVYGIIKQAAGFLRVASAPGQGAEFSIYLPKAGPQEGSLSSHRVLKTAVASNKTILLVEDDESVRKLAETVLKTGGYIVFVATSGEEALELLGSGRIHPDLLVTDVIMHAMDGFTLAGKAGVLIPGLRSLFISGYAGERLKEFSIDTSQTHFIQKPFYLDAFLEKIQDILAQEEP